MTRFALTLEFLLALQFLLPQHLWIRLWLPLLVKPRANSGDPLFKVPGRGHVGAIARQHGLERQLRIRRCLEGRTYVKLQRTREPGREPLDGGLELRVRVDEALELLGHPRQGDLLVTPALLELLDAAIGEVHQSS